MVYKVSSKAVTQGKSYLKITTTTTKTTMKEKEKRKTKREKRIKTNIKNVNLYKI